MYTYLDSKYVYVCSPLFVLTIHRQTSRLTLSSLPGCSIKRTLYYIFKPSASCLRSFTSDVMRSQAKEVIAKWIRS